MPRSQHAYWWRTGRLTAAAALAVLGFGGSTIADGLAPAAARMLSLGEALEMAKKNSPSIEARQAQEAASAASVGVAKSGYLPTASVQGIDSFGFPGSTGYLGIGGVAGSPYRSGWAGDVVVQQEVYDFGKTEASIDVAKKDVETRRQETKVEAERVQANVLRTFIECSRLRSEAELFGALKHDAEVIAKEVRTFVRTGQRSVVDRYLSEAQVEEAATSQAAAESRLAAVEHTLALAVGATLGSVSCPALSAGPQWDLDLATLDQNPYVAASAASLATERARKEAVRATYRPSINLLGSVGIMQRSRLVEKSPYAVGVGISVPVFSGFKDDYELERSDALINGRQLEVSARKLEVLEANSRFDEQIAASATRIEHLRRERTLADQAFKIAKRRYFAAEGDLTDLREAIRNRSRTNASFDDAVASSAEATGAKALLNGGHLVAAGSGPALKPDQQTEKQ